jgi:WS/DGAT/MGAT family acyltransferase
VVFTPSLTHHPNWEDDQNFELDRHIERVRLAPPGTQVELENFISQLMSVPLDYNRPLWKIYFIEHYGSGSVIVARLHHAIADGIALMHVLLTMASEEPDAPLPRAVTLHKLPRKRIPSITGKGESSDLERMASLSADLFGKVTDEGFRMLTDRSYARRQAGLGASAALTFGKMLLRIPDPPTVFKAQPGYEKRAAWSDPLPLEQVKQVGRSLDATVNDVLLSNVAGALRRYLRSIGRPVADLNIRSFVPVNLRPLDLAKKLGNEFGLVMLSLPLGIEDPVERLHELKRRMDIIKSTPEAAVAFGVLAVLGAAPEAIHGLGVQIFDTKASAVMTNVPGPKKRLYLAGAPIETVMAWVPQSGRISLGVSIISYNGKVWVGVTSDKELVPEPSRILQHFIEEFHSLHQRPAVQPAPPSRSMAAILADLDKAIDIVDGLLNNQS